MNALRDAIIAMKFSWVAVVRSGLSRGDRDVDELISPEGNPLPCIICSATLAIPTTPQIATFSIQCSVSVHHQADDSMSDTVMDQVGQVFDYLYGDSLKNDLNLTNNFTALHINRGQQRFEIVGRTWVSTMDLEIYAAGSEIT